jgi:hypothetical protein
MMKKTAKKLALPKEIVRDLQVPELVDVAGGKTATCLCDSCGNPRSTCPV